MIYTQGIHKGPVTMGKCTHAQVFPRETPEMNRLVSMSGYFQCLPRRLPIWLAVSGGPAAVPEERGGGIGCS